VISKINSEFWAGALLAIYIFYSFITGKDRTIHFSEAHSGQMRGNGHKLEPGDSLLFKGETFFFEAGQRLEKSPREVEES